MKMRAALESYLSVSESDGEEKKGNMKAGARNALDDRKITVAMRLISHSDSSEEEKADRRVGDTASVGEKELGNEAEDDPDYLASDSPLDEYQSA